MAQPLTTDRSHRPAHRSVRAILVLLIPATLLLASDLGLKHWAFAHATPEPVDVHRILERQAPLPDDTISVVPSVLSIKLTLNLGAVFGLGQGYRWVFVVATVVAMAVIGYFFCQSHDRQWLVHIALALVLAGAVGNLYDRMWYGAVRDMLWLFPGLHLPFGLNWPGGATDLYPWIFNAADVFLLVGIGLIMIKAVFAPDPVGDDRATEADAAASGSDAS